MAKSSPNASLLLVNSEPTFDQWVTELEHIASVWRDKNGNLPYRLPLCDSTGLECWRIHFDDDMTPQQAFDSDQSYWAE